MPVAAVLGWPLAHTLSPALHNAAYRACGLPGWRYEARPTRPEELPAALAAVRAGELAGVNVTVPHKQAAAALLDALEPPADALGAVNTVVGRDGRLTGTNTDVPGGLWALQTQLGLAEGGWDGHGPAVLLGSGGAALAMALAWRQLTRDRARRGLPTAPLTVVGRDLDRAGAVAAHAGAEATAAPFAHAATHVAAARVLIQATTLTAHGQPVPGQGAVRAGVRVLDVNYGPHADVLLAAARTAGAAAAADGLGMLVSQAAAAFTRITGCHTPDPFPAMAAAVGLPYPVEPAPSRPARR